MALLEQSDGCIDLAVMEQFQCLLCQGVYLALVNAGKEVGILAHVLLETVQFVVSLIEGILILLLLHLAGIQLGLQLCLLLVVLLLCLAFTNFNEVRFLSLKLVGVAKDEA